MAAVDEESPLLSAEVSRAELYHSSMQDTFADDSQIYLTLYSLRSLPACPDVDSTPPYHAEAPPPYCAVPADSNSVCCGVCAAQIAVNANSRFIVKCRVCNEFTPIGSPPAGKRFVRCECHCLLLCKISSQRGMCPRPHCKRVIEMTAAGLNVGVVQSLRAVCGHCSQTFTVSQSTKSKPVRCPYCRKVSLIGTNPMKRWVYFYINIFSFFFYTAGLIVGTVLMAEMNYGLIAAWAWWPMMFMFCVFGAVYWARMKISTPLQSSSV